MVSQENACRACQGETRPFDSGLVLDRYTVRYFQCVDCGFVQTETPFWLSEAYTQAIATADIGLISRNLHLAGRTEVVLNAFFNSAARYVDFGGGYGMLVRMLRDVGLNFFRQDRYCANLFAAGFDVEEASPGSWGALTAFEVFEHLPDPITGIEEMLRFSRNILFTTELLPRNVSSLADWWYFSPSHGQHVAFYTQETLASLAARYDLNFYTDGVSFHLLTDQRINRLLFRALSRGKVAEALRSPLRTYRRRKSLLPADAERLRRASIAAIS